MPEASPILVTSERGGYPETVHRGTAVVLAHDGSVAHAWGDIDRLIFPRSLIKPLHAVVLITSGAAARYSLGTAEMALAASSHLGKAEHIELIRSWCSKIGITEESLLCGTHRPHDNGVADEMAMEGLCPTAIHNNNSGRHLAVLTICKYLNTSIDDYRDSHHPVQKLLRETTELLTGRCYDHSFQSMDVCGMPTAPIPCRSLCLGALRMTVWPQRADIEKAGQKVLAAMAIHPNLVLGPKKFSSTITEVTDGDIIIKTGSEGGFWAVSRSRARAALTKIDDGSLRASMALVVEVLRAGGLVSEDAYKLIRLAYGMEIKGYTGDVTGYLQVNLGCS